MSATIVTERLLTPKNYATFLQRLRRRSDATAKTYHDAVTHLAQFLQQPTPDDTAPLLRTHDPCDLLDAFAGWLNQQGYRAKTIRTWISGARKWLAYHGIYINDAEFRERVLLPRAQAPAKGDRADPTLLRQILLRLPTRYQLITLILKSSGLRPQDIPRLRFGDFRWDETPVRIPCVPREDAHGDLAKTDTSWETFIDHETSTFLRRHFQDRIRDATAYLFPDVTPGAIYHAFRRAAIGHAARGEPNLRSLVNTATRPYGQRYQVKVYSLKDFFASQVELAHHGDRSNAQAWMGRQGYLATYFRQPLESRRHLYRLAEPHLALLSPPKPTAETELVRALRDTGRERGLSEAAIEGLAQLVANYLQQHTA